MKRFLIGVMLSMFFLLPVLADYVICPAGYTSKEYTDLEYIETSGTQYIDTGFKAHTTTSRYETKIMLAAMENAQAIFGSRNVSNTADISACEMFVYQNSLRLDWVSGDPLVLQPATVNTEHTINITRGQATINGKHYSYSNRTAVEQENNFLIGNLSNGSASPWTTGFIGRIYYGRLYSNETLVRDFIPVRRKSDGAVGMYDRVENEFYLNAGTGEFVAGPEIDDGCKPCSANTYKTNPGDGDCTPCPEGTFSPIGSNELSDCAKILRINDYVVYMPFGRRTEHGLCTMFDGKKYCADVYERQ